MKSDKFNDHIRTERKINFNWLYDRLWDDDKRLLLLLKTKTLPDMEDIASKNESNLIDDFFGLIEFIRQISTEMGIFGITKNAENTVLPSLIKEALNIGHDIRKIEGKVNINYTDYHQELAQVLEEVTEHI